MESINEKKKIRRSRNGCHRCKKQKIKCDERKPSCSYCAKSGTPCDYSMKLTWGGRPFKNLEKRQSTTDDTGKISKKMSKSSSTGDILFIVNSFDTKNIKPNAEPLKKSKSESRGGESSTNSGDNVRTLEMQRSSSTPGNSAILPFNSSREENLLNVLGTPASSHSHLLGPLIQSPNTGTPGSPGDKPLLIEHFPGISDGIESLSEALESIASGGNLFNIKNSEIFHNFILSNLDDKKDEELQPTTQVPKSQTSPSPGLELKRLEVQNTNPPGAELTPTTSFTPVATSGAWDNANLENYSADLSKIELIMPHLKSNLLEDLLSPDSSMFSKKAATSSSSVDSGKNVDTSDIGSQLQEMNPLDAFNVIPPSISPLPEVILQVPYYRELFHFWLTVASDHLVPAPSTMYHENPFKVILPRMAMESPSILTTLLAFAETVRAQYDFSLKESKQIIDHLLARSCTELLKLLQDKKRATSDATLATVLLLSCLEVFSCGNFDRHRAHTLGARQIILSRGLKITKNKSKRIKEMKDSERMLQVGRKIGSISARSNGNDSVTEAADDALSQVKSEIDGLTKSQVSGNSELYYSPVSTISSLNNDAYLDDSDSSSESHVTYFLMRWFAYVDVIGALSATKHADNYLSHKQGEDLYHTNSAEQVEGYKSGDIDRLLGFDLIFLPLLADIALLIRLKNNYLLTSGSRSDMIPTSLITRALEAKETLSAAFASGEAKRKERLERALRRANFASNTLDESASSIIRKDTILRSTNKIFFNMGLLNLYRRVLAVDRKSSLVQDLCEEIGDILQLSIEPKSPAEICSIFCTFCAACESTNIAMQQLFHARFTTLAEMGLNNAKKSLEIMERCWETGADWMFVANELDIDFTLL